MLKTFLVGVFIACATVCHGQDFAAAVPDYPERLKAVRFGMSAAEIQKAIPEAKAATATDAPRASMAVFFDKQPAAWDAAMLDLVDGRVAGINLLIGVNKASDVAQRSQARLDALIARNGPNYTRTLSLRSSALPVPTRVWVKADLTVVAVGPSAGISSAGKDVVRADPNLHVGLSPKGRPLGEIVEVPTPAQLIDMMFRALSPGAQ